MSQARTRRSVPPVVMRPSFVSQSTTLALLGLCPRKFLEVLVPKCKADVIRVGRTVLIPLDVAEATLRTLAMDAVELGDDTVAEDDVQFASVDAVLASVGARRRVP